MVLVGRDRRVSGLRAVYAAPQVLQKPVDRTIKTAPVAKRVPQPSAMTDNRRNHYRVLHVQADAPVEVIKASWRTLMSRLRQHPDLGGSHAQAVMVNEAWAVLGDPDRRAAYDLQRRRITTALLAGDGGHSRLTPGGQPDADLQRAALPTCGCPLCTQPFAGPLRPDSRCTQCHSPLAALAGAGLQGTDAAGHELPAHDLPARRGAVRRDQTHVALVHVGWPSPALPVRWRDLSLTGLSFYAPQPLAIGQRLRLIDSALEGVVEVVGCRAQGRVFAVHARLLTALLMQATGVFVSAQA
jgi:hypothetical protein